MASTEKKVLSYFVLLTAFLLLADSSRYVDAKTLTMAARPHTRATRDIVLEHEQGQEPFLVRNIKEEANGDRIKRQASITMTQGVVRDSPASLLPANSTSAVSMNDQLPPKKKQPNCPNPYFLSLGTCLLL